MLKKRNKIIKKLLTLVFVFSFCLSVIQINAQYIKKTETNTKQITITKNDMKFERQTIETPAQKQSFEKFFNKHNFASGTDSEVLVTNDYSGHPAVTSNGQGNAVLFVEYQNEGDPLIREIVSAPSFDNGLTWDLELAGVFPSEEGVNKLPALDFRSGLTAYGTWIMVEPNGIMPIARLEDISDPLGGEGWVYWAPDWSDNFEEIGPFYSTDVACYDGPLNEEPDVFWGIAMWTGKLNDSVYGHFDNGIFLIWFSGEYIRISWFPDIDGVYNIVGDIDQSNGMIYWAYEVYNTNTRVNDLWLMYISMEDWFIEESSFSIWNVAGPVKNPAIMAENGIVNVVFENEGDLYCLYSSDNAETIEISTVTESEDDELFPDINGNGLEAICAFNKNENLYIAETTDGGITWEVKETQINDEQGSVANEYHCINLVNYRAFWTDTRNGIEDIYSDYLLPPPEIPTIYGPSNGKRNIEYDFNLTTTHPEGLDIWYWIDWGNGDNSGWLGPYPPESEITVSHTWLSREVFTIKARVKDEKQIYSNWAEYKFSTPRNKMYYQMNLLIDRFIQLFPLFEKILNQIK
jgi:hypothetical protein